MRGPAAYVAYRRSHTRFAASFGGLSIIGGRAITNAAYRSPRNKQHLFVSGR